MSGGYYGTIYPQFWSGPTGRAITAGGPEVRILATYLLTNNYATMIGLYRLVPYDIFTETGLTRAEVAHAFHYLSHIEFATYDSASQHVWVHQMAHFRLGLHAFRPLKTGDKRIKGAQNLYDRLEDNPFLELFFTRYAKDVRLKKGRRSKLRKITPLHAEKEAVAPHRKARPISRSPLKGLQGSDGPMKTVVARNGSRRNHEGASSPLKGLVSPLKPVQEERTYVASTCTAGVPSQDLGIQRSLYFVTGAIAPAHTHPVENKENPRPRGGYAEDPRRVVATALRDRDGPAPRGRSVPGAAADGPRGLVRVGGTHQMPARAAPPELPGPAAPVDQGDGSRASRVAEARGRAGPAAAAPAAARATERRSAVAENPLAHRDVDLRLRVDGGPPALRHMIANIREAYRRFPPAPRPAV